MPPLHSFFFHRRLHRGIALLQVLLTLAIIAVVGSLSLPSYRRAQATANRNRCDVQLKSIALALDAYRQVHHRFPPHLEELHKEEFLKDEADLHCPCDPREHPSYEEFYVLRSRDDGSNTPWLMCPFHENIGAGNQARIGLYTTQFATRPALLESGNAVTVETPGQDPQPGYAGMQLHGGDRITTGKSGLAVLAFADGSNATLQSGTSVTVLQSFVDGHQIAPLYTVLRQTTGQATYTVHHGSHFDVTTPTATAGARGTQFTLTITPNEDFAQTGLTTTTLKVTEGKVAFTGGGKTVLVTLGQTLEAVGGLVGGLLGGIIGGLLG